MAPRTTRTYTLAAIAGLLGLAACGDARTRNFSRGIERDSVLTLIGAAGAQGDTIPNVQRVARYITGGHTIEVLFYNPEPTMERTDSLNRSQAIPLVLSDGKLVGWGWDHWDSTATANRIRMNGGKQ